MKIASFNTNGVRARLSIIKEWLERERPDVLCIQETKVQDQDFPREPFEDSAYHCTFRGQKSFNGVAILSKTPPTSVSFGFGDGDAKEEPRMITVFIDGIPIVNTYIPQGTAPDSERFQYKLEWFHRLHDYFSTHFQPSEPLVWLGDFNVADKKAYTFWDYRVPYAFRRGIGWRVDHIWATQCLAEKCIRSWIDVGPRQLEKPSDHTFILAKFEI
jgi:exodeoxyribonuclease-3